MASDRAFLTTAAFLFTLSAATTIVWSAAMSGMGDMAMPGGWAMSMTWMRMGGGSWLEAAMSFLVMWIVMMVAMMLPAVVPFLRQYRAAVGRAGASRLGWLTALAGLSYFAVWAALGLAVFPLGVIMAGATMQEPQLARAVPLAMGGTVVIAGLLQFIPWKAHHLACCRAIPAFDRRLPADAFTALQQGLRYGHHCVLCCANLMTVLLVIGVMDWRAMTAVTAAITLERLTPASMRMAEAVGAVTVGAGLLLIVRAAGLS